MFFKISGKNLPTIATRVVTVTVHSFMVLPRTRTDQDTLWILSFGSAFSWRAFVFCGSHGNMAAAWTPAWFFFCQCFWRCVLENFGSDGSLGLQAPKPVVEISPEAWPSSGLRINHSLANFYAQYFGSIKPQFASEWFVGSKKKQFDALQGDFF